MNENNEENYLTHYSDDNFWNKIKKHYKRTGRKILELAITLFYALKDEDTPKWAKTIIIGALGYFILPLDVIPDFIPITGFTDDFVSIMVALGAVSIHIKDEHKDKANDIVDRIIK